MDAHPRTLPAHIRTDTYVTVKPIQDNRWHISHEGLCAFFGMSVLVADLSNSVPTQDFKIAVWVLA